MKRSPLAIAIAAAALSSLVATTAAKAAQPAPNPPAQPPAWHPEAATYGVSEQSNVPVTMPDGTVLRVDVYTPTVPSTGKDAAGPFPVLLTQTPYGKSSLGADTYFVQRGYIEVVADVRGTGDSEGSFGLFDPAQGQDGANLVYWSARLPHSDGKVGLFGSSYLGINQFLTVANLPPGSPVKAMFPVISANDIYRDTAFDGGLFDSEFDSIYTGLVLGVQSADPATETAQAPSSGSASDLIETQSEHAGSVATYYVPTAANVETGGSLDYDSNYWLDRSPATYLARVVADKVPAFLVGGWYDLFQHGEPLNYVQLQNLYFHRPVNAPLRPGEPVTGRYQLLMGPWYHLTAGNGINLDVLQLRWFDNWLKGEATGIGSTSTPLHLNVLGSSSYVDTAAWPPDPAATTTMFMNSGGALATSPSAPGKASLAFTGMSAACDRETSQWMMGADNLAGSDPCTNYDNDIQAGPGSITFTTAPMPADKVLAGPINVSVSATDTVSDAEWIANVEEVQPSGLSVPITAGALLGSFRAVDTSKSWAGQPGRLLLAWHPYSPGSSRPVVPGALTRYNIEVFPTFALIPKGDELRVTLSTSDTPHLMPNAGQLANLAGGSYTLQLGAGSYMEAILAPSAKFTTPCALCTP
jgi:putative CocE/NonD family hydrolase